MTKREAAIISAYTGYLLGSFDDMQRYVDEKLGMSTWTHMYARQEFADRVRAAATADFMALDVIDE